MGFSPKYTMRDEKYYRDNLSLYATAMTIKKKCPRWKEWEGRGGCILLVKSGKYGRL